MVFKYAVTLGLVKFGRMERTGSKMIAKHQAEARLSSGLSHSFANLVD